MSKSTLILAREKNKISRAACWALWSILFRKGISRERCVQAVVVAWDMQICWYCNCHKQYLVNHLRVFYKAQKGK